jgi:N-acetylglucosamine kinase-like BadF-type ATPase
MMRIAGGIDAGGTRTRVALAREDGTVIGFAEGGCSSFAELGIDKATDVLTRLWQAAWASASMSPRPVDGLFIGSGSILYPDDIETNRTIAVSAGLASAGRVQAENDAWSALAGALTGRPGILLISGTGSACLGRDARGRTWRAGGWGHLLNDVGSAYELGQAAMVAATRAADGRGKPTSLSTMVCEQLGLRDLNQIYRKLHHEGVSRAHVAALAPQVVALAEAGDEVARSIIIEGVEGLAEMVGTVARQLKLNAPEIALTGGLITSAASFRRECLDRLAKEVTDFTLASGGVIPVLGAVILALEVATKAPAENQCLQKLRSTSAHFTGLHNP